MALLKGRNFEDSVGSALVVERPVPKLAANLTMMFTELPFLQRFGAAREAGFDGVEYLFPYDHGAAEIAAELGRHRLQQVLFNLWPGDWAAGERGLAILPGRQAAFRDSVAQAATYAAATGCRRLHAMAGIMPTGVMADSAGAVGLRRTYIDNLRYAADTLRDLTILIEPINRRDMPGYFLSNTADAAAIIADAGAPNLRLQLDLYHCQVSEGDLVRRIEALFPLIGHVQIAGNPDRQEPDRGEVNYPYLIDRLDALGYDGWVGCEYRPRAGTRAGLAWALPYGICPASAPEKLDVPTQ